MVYMMRKTSKKPKGAEYSWLFEDLGGSSGGGKIPSSKLPPTNSPQQALWPGHPPAGGLRHLVDQAESQYLEMLGRLSTRLSSNLISINSTQSVDC